MPSKNPRLILTLKPDLYQSISRLAEAREVPKARAVTDLLSEMQTAIDRLTEALDEAKKKPEMAFQMLMENLNDAQVKAAQAQADMFKKIRPKA
jgi:molecular chaperone GrpE (heat shock protein)